MNRIVLNYDIVDKIRKDTVLSQKVADELGISVKSLPRLLWVNDPRLTQAGVLRILKKYLKVVKDNELLSELQISAVA